MSDAFDIPTEVSDVTIVGPLPLPVTGTIITSPDVNIHASNADPLTVTGTSLNVNVTNSIPVTIPTPVPVTQSTTPWITDSSGTIQPVSGTVAVSNFPVVQTVAISQTGTNNDVEVVNGAGAAAVNIQDGGNSITVDGTVAISNFPATQPISGTVTVIQPTGTNLHAVIDSGSTTAVTGNVIVVQPTGTNLHTVTDTGSTTIVTGNVTVVQPTGMNLHVVVDSAPTTSVTQGTSPWVISGTVTAAGTQDTNLIQIKGVSVSTASGTTDSGTQRVVLPTDQTAIPVTDNGGSITVDGTVTANQGTANTIANAWPIKLTDGTDTADITATSALKVDGSAVTQPVSGTVAVTQSTSPWVVSGTVTANLGTIDGAATAANQTTANTSLASIDSKLTAPLSTTETQKTTGLIRSGEVATAATTTTFIRKSTLNNTITTDTALTISSSSVNDTLAGTGAQKVKVTYYLQTGAGPFTTTASMNGTTIVFLPAMSFVERMEVVQVGSGGVCAGTVFITLLAPLTQIAAITAGDNESYWCHHFVPLGKTCYITGFSYCHTGTAAANGGLFLLTKQNIPLAGSPITHTFGSFHLQGTDGTQEMDFRTPVIVTGPAYLVATITPDASTANSYFAAMNFYDL